MDEPTLQGITESVRHTESLIDTISEDSLDDWKDKYDYAFDDYDYDARIKAA